MERREFELGDGHRPSRRLDASSVSANPRLRNRGVSRDECRAVRLACRPCWRNSTTTSARPCWRPTAPSTAPSTSATTRPWTRSGRRPAPWSACIPARGPCTSAPISCAAGSGILSHPESPRGALHRRMGGRPRRASPSWSAARSWPTASSWRPTPSPALSERLAHGRPPLRPGAADRDGQTTAATASAAAPRDRRKLH